jgi:NitT/TauT family transport system substrate-binding protein
MFQNVHKSFIFSIILMFLIGILGACGVEGTKTGLQETNNTEKNAEDAKTQTVLVTEAFHSLLYLPLYVGYHKGIFENNRIHISGIRSSGSGPAALSSVLAGEAQFSVHGIEHVGFAKENGGEARAITAVANSAPVWILANPDVDFNGPEDLAGKHIIVGLAPTTSNTLLKRLLQDNGLEWGKNVTVTEVQNGSELGPVLAGQADIAVAYQPQVEQGISQGLEIIYDFTEDYPEYAFSTFNVALKTIEQDPDLVKRFAKSMQETLDLIHAQPSVAVEVAKLEFPELDENVLKDAVERMIDSKVYPKSAKVTEEAFRTAIEMQQYVGNIKGDMFYKDIVDPNFVE